MAKSGNASASKADARKGLGVRVPLWALLSSKRTKEVSGYDSLHYTWDLAGHRSRRFDYDPKKNVLMRFNIVKQQLEGKKWLYS